jgi:hypothetical protein
MIEPSTEGSKQQEERIDSWGCATGRFSSRKIEDATYSDVAVDTDSMLIVGQRVTEHAK